MKSAIVLLAAAIFAGAPAAAQPHQQGHPGGGMGHPAMHAPAMHAPHPAMHAMRPAMHAHYSHRTYRHGVARRVSRHTRHPVLHRHPSSRMRHGIHHAVHAAARPSFRRAPRAFVNKLRRNVVAVHRFHAGPYRAPPGFRYRRWVFGERLPAIYFAPAFWITDFLAFGLFAPPDGYVWVRYGPDALLIDEYTGEIIQVQYGLFF